MVSANPSSLSAVPGLLIAGRHVRTTLGGGTFVGGSPLAVHWLVRPYTVGIVVGVAGAFNTTGPYNYYCAPCITAAEKSGRSKYQFLSRKAETIPASRKCGGCHEAFAPQWVTQKYCDDGCKATARRTTPKGLLNSRMASAVRRAMNGLKAGRSWTRLVGYTAEELREHIERQFLKGMSWEEADKFHIDHIVPLATFNFDSAEHPEFRAAWALTNLRPLWATANISKGARRTHLI